MDIILEQKIKVKLYKRIIPYYESLGYDTTQKIIEVDVVDLKPTAKIKIKCKCDKCGEIFYRTRSKIPKLDGLITCKKCKSYKIKQTNLEKYDVECVFELESVRNKIKRTNKERYGDEIFTNTKIFKEKAKKIFQEKYNVDFPFQSKEIQNKKDETIMKKYNVSNISLLEKVKQKRKKTWKEKYGVDHPWKSDYIKQKLKKRI